MTDNLRTTVVKEDTQDPYLDHPFSFQDKLRRFCWTICWGLLCRWTPKPLHFWRRFILRLFGAKLGKQNFIYPTCTIWAPWLLETGDLVTIGPGVEVYNPGGIKIGHHSILSQHSFLCGATHDYDVQDFTYLKKPIILEPYVWICARAIVLPGVHCQEGSILGAASVTSRDLLPWSLYAGNPCKKIKERNNFLKKKK
ncbi:MAG: putative colanic acid biosynthesis acetyltransferase [Lewinella sp.]